MPSSPRLASPREARRAGAARAEVDNGGEKVGGGVGLGDGPRPPDHPETDSTDHDCQEELNSFLQIKASTDAMTARILKSAKIDPPRLSPAVRMIDHTGLLFILAGYLSLVGFAGYHLLTAPDLNPVVKYAYTAVIIGLSILFARVAIGRLTGDKDPYEEIDQ